MEEVEKQADVERSAQTSISDVYLADIAKAETHDPAHIESTFPHNVIKTHSSHPLEQTESHRTYSGFKWFLVCVALYMSAFLYGLDNTIVADIQAATVETFGEVQQLAWVGVGFPLGSIATILPVGKAFGIFDVKWTFISSIILFEIGSAVCGSAPSMDALIVGRVIAGAGGSGMYLGVLNIVSLNTSMAERPLYIALCAFAWGLGCVLGPVIGGSLADSGATWRWAFYLNLVIFAVSAPVFLFVLDSFNPQKDVKTSEKFKYLDWVGVVLNAGMYATFVMAFTFGGTQWAWNDGRVITLIVVFGVLLIVFGIQQTFSIFTTPERRIFPVDFLKDRQLLIQYIAMSCGSSALFVAIYYLPLYFDFAKGDSNVESAVRLLPFMFFTIGSSLLNGALMPKWGYYAPWFLLSGIFSVIGGALMYTLVDANTSPSQIYGFSILLGLGAGLSVQAGYSVVQSKVPITRIADAVNFMNSAQIGAIVFSLTISGAVFQNLGFKHISDVLVGQNFTAEDIHSALAGVQSTVFTDVSSATRQQIIDAIVTAMNNSYILIFVGGAVNIVSSLLMKWERLSMEMSAGA